MYKPFFVYTDPFTRINDRWLLKNLYLQNLIRNLPDNFQYKNFEEEDLHNITTSIARSPDWSYDLVQQSFLHVITETAYNYPNPFLSEKIVKPIAGKRPFVLIAPLGSLENVRNIGFKTFSQYWDESYDNIVDPEQRILAVIEIIEWLCSKPIDYIQNLCSKMSDVLEYNCSFYNKHLMDNELEKLNQNCLENLKPRYD